MTTLNSRIVDVAWSALRDLHGLVPQQDRKTADDYVFALESALEAYRNSIEQMQQIESALCRGGQYIERKLTELELRG